MKKIILAVTFLVIVHHFIMTALYVGPKNPFYNDYVQYNRSYMEPLFSQHWGLFAPEPATNELKLWYKCKDQNGERAWLDALSLLSKKHQDNRFTFRGKLSYIYTSMIRGLYNETIKLKKKCGKNCQVNELIHKLSSYKSTRRLVGDLCKKEQLDIHKFNIVLHSPKDFSKRDIEGEKGKILFLSYK